MDAPKGLSRKRARKHHSEETRARRDVSAVAVVYGGTIAAVFVLLATDTETLATSLLLENGLFLLVGALGVWRLGALRGTLAAAPQGRDLPLAVPAAALMLAFGLAWAFAVALLSGETAELSFGVPPLGLLLEVAIAPALVEEWLCRGVLWNACERLTTTRRTIAATALLFALMHVPAWGLLGLPAHAFAGIVLGVLRARTRSLAPCALAHFLNNAVAAAMLVG